MATNRPITESLDECIANYEKDIQVQTHCCVLSAIPKELQDKNRKIFHLLVGYQKDITARGTLPFVPDDAARRKKHKSAVEGDVPYPESLFVESYRTLRQILPIPDIHKVSDCDTIYRFIIARKGDEKLAVQDLLYYIAFREKYNLNHILWDREVEAMQNGMDGEELLQQTIELIAKKTKDKDPSTVNLKKLKVPRSLLQVGWSAWNCGVDRTGHVVYYQKPNPKELALLDRRWKYVEGAYDCRSPSFDATPPYANLLVRLYLRVIENGRRLSRLLNYNGQTLIREDLQSDVREYDSDRRFRENGGGMNCLLDVGSVKLSHLTGPKCKDAIRVFRMLSVMSQFYYPENMKKMIIINGGLIFNFVFKMIKPWLDPQTQKKITLLSATNAASVDDLESAPSPINPTPKDADSDDDDEEAGKGGDDKANYALREALESHIDTAFIPSWYGGQLQTIDAPVSCGGELPRRLTQHPLYALAAQHVQARVVPSLLSDEFLLAHTKAGAPVGDAEWEAFRAHLQQQRRRR
ncbi:hypothetical protein STCU_03546 [Strigomonas culicis]|uniref:CRAL-TRIO domain-containing protein n=1 Tax=Strigomonas culicis TaxID=28005 RepID=S9U7C4_9TRYP|nr:hypothetical protein STCU_07052 [Strigomonas culicis]EPY31254.1 hypothetical protein STCU_03546 [Strigomonas culicis]|eukprot:EPY24694.1 hypothetical protein STCU_07052 [Strigomonas culicis]